MGMAAICFLFLSTWVLDGGYRQGQLLQPASHLYVETDGHRGLFDLERDRQHGIGAIVSS
jgi:hypothetical protein